MNKPLLIGGALVAGYFLFIRGKKTAAAPKPTAPKPGGFYLPPLTTAGGLSARGEEILADPSSLEGYYLPPGSRAGGQSNRGAPIRSLKGYFSTGCTSCR